MVVVFALVKEEFMIPVTLTHVLQILPVSEQSSVTSTAIAPSNLYPYTVKLNRVLCIVGQKQHLLTTQSSFIIRWKMVPPAKMIQIISVLMGSV